jgi:hypothetical protein
MSDIDEAAEAIIAATPAPADAPGLVVVVERGGIVRVIDPKTARQIGSVGHVTTNPGDAQRFDPKVAVERVGVDRFLVATSSEVALFTVNGAVFDGSAVTRFTVPDTLRSKSNVADLVVVGEDFWLLDNAIGPRLLTGSMSSQATTLDLVRRLRAGRAAALKPFGTGFVAAGEDYDTGFVFLDVLAADGSSQFEVPVRTSFVYDMIVENATGRTRMWLFDHTHTLRVLDLSGCVP